MDHTVRVKGVLVDDRVRFEVVARDDPPIKFDLSTGFRNVTPAA